MSDDVNPQFPLPPSPQPSLPSSSSTPLALDTASPKNPPSTTIKWAILITCGVVCIAAIAMAAASFYKPFPNDQNDTAAAQTKSDSSSPTGTYSDDEPTPYLDKVVAIEAVRQAVSEYIAQLQQHDAQSLHTQLSEAEKMNHPASVIANALSNSGFVLTESNITGGITFTNTGYPRPTEMVDYQADDRKIYLAKDKNVTAAIPLTVTYTVGSGASHQKSVNLTAEWEDGVWKLSYLGPSHFIIVNHIFNETKENEAIYNGTVSAISGEIESALILAGINETWVNFRIKNSTDYRTDASLKDSWTTKIGCNPYCEISDDFSTRIGSDRHAFLNGKSSLTVGEEGQGYVVFEGIPHEKAKAMYITLNFLTGYSFRTDIKTGALPL